MCFFLFGNTLIFLKKFLNIKISKKVKDAFFWRNSTALKREFSNLSRTPHVKYHLKTHAWEARLLYSTKDSRKFVRHTFGSRILLSETFHITRSYKIWRVRNTSDIPCRIQGVFWENKYILNNKQKFAVRADCNHYIVTRFVQLETWCCKISYNIGTSI